MSISIPGPDNLSGAAEKSFWQEISHPFFWITEKDLPRLKQNAESPFWKEKFDSWRLELRKLDSLQITTPTIDFHIGTNKTALKAGMCYIVDGDERYGRLIGSFLSAVAEFYRQSPDWRKLMCANDSTRFTGNQWGGLTNSHIVDPQMWLSMGHLYDLIYGRDLMPTKDSETFEEMMALFYQLSCLHEELKKLDNNRAVWLAAGGYLSTMFDRNRRRGDYMRKQYRETMPHFLETILPDGIHYEIGGYGPGTIAAMQVFARCIRGAEGIDFFQEKIDGIGMEEAYRAWAGTLIPGGTSLRLPCLRDRINHWDSIGAGYLEYDIPEIGWALSKIHERSWVPMFQHWPQGFEFYTYKEPADPHPPCPRHNLFPAAGMAILRSSWEPGATSIYFRYGFQGSSHGGGLDKLNFELTCHDETLIADPMLTERSYDKNVVVVDGQCQEQCSGKLLYAAIDENTQVQYVSALSGFGTWPNRPFLNDPRAEINYWCVKNNECFPGLVRMRRTIVQVAGHVYIIRDTCWSLDNQEHDYEWLYHTFAQPEPGKFRRREVRVYEPRRIFHSEPTPPLRRKVDVYLPPTPMLRCAARETMLIMQWSATGASPPREIGISREPARYAFNGSPETGDGFSSEIINRLHLQTRGTDISLTMLLIPYAFNEKPEVKIEQIQDHSLDRVELSVRINGGSHRIIGEEDIGVWRTI